MPRTRRSKRANRIPLAVVSKRGTPVEPIYADRRPGHIKLVAPEVLERYLTALRSGSTRRLASEFAGLNYRTVQRWMSWANGPASHPNPDPDIVRFRRLTIEAEAAAAVLVTGNLVASSRNPVAALAWLRQRQAQDWPKDPEPVPEDLAPVMIDARQQTANVIVLDPSQYPEVVRQILEARREAARALPQPEPAIEAANGTGIRHASLDALRAETDDHPA